MTQAKDQRAQRSAFASPGRPGGAPGDPEGSRVASVWSSWAAPADSSYRTTAHTLLQCSGPQASAACLLNATAASRPDPVLQENKLHGCAWPGDNSGHRPVGSGIGGLSDTTQRSRQGVVSS